MAVMALASFMLLAGYTAAVCMKQGGVPESVSASFYKIEHKEAFSVCMCGAALTLLPPMLERTQEEWQFLAFLACAGLLMVGCAPRFKEGVERKVHVAGATLLLVCSQLWVLAVESEWLLLWGTVAAWIVYNVMEFGRAKGLALAFEGAKPLFWTEMTALTAGYMALVTG